MRDDFSLDGRSPRRPPSSDGGESAWDLGEVSTEPTPGAARDRDRRAEEPATDDALAALLQSISDGDDDDAGRGRPAIDIIRLLRGCWHRRLLIASVTLVVAALFVVLALTQIAHTWTASTVLLKRKTVDDLTLGEGKSFQPQSFSLQTLLDTLKLPSSLDTVMARSELEVRRTTFAGAIDIRLGRESEVLQLQATWEDPRTAAVIANNMAAVFLEKTVDIQRRDAQEALDYYRAQLDQARSDRREADAAVLAFEQAHGLSDFDAETTARLGALAQLEAEHQAQLSEAAALRESSERLRAKIAAEPEMVIEQTIYRSPLKQRLNNYQWELREARSRYTADNPKVQKLQQKVDVLERMIGDNRDESVPENSYAPNSYRQDLQLSLDELERSIGVADANAGALARTLQELRAKLSFLNAREKEFLRLESQQRAAQSLEERLTQRANEARLQALRAEPAFDVLEAAVPPDEPNPSGRKLVAVGGAVLGAGLGLGIALLLELLDPFVRSRRDGVFLTGVELCTEWAAAEDGKLHSIDDDETLARQFRQLVNQIDAQIGPARTQSLAILAAGPEEGQDEFAANLAMVFAAKERRTLLVDAATSGAQRAAHMAGANTDDAGIYDVLEGAIPLREALHRSAHANLSVIPAGDDTKPEAIALLGSRRMAALAGALRDSNRQVVYALPAATGQETVLEAASEIGATILVMRSGCSRRTPVKELVATLTSRQIDIVAAVVLDIPEKFREQPSGDRRGGPIANLFRGAFNV